MLVKFGSVYVDPAEIAAISPNFEAYGYDHALFLRSGKIVGVDVDDLEKRMEEIGVYDPAGKTTPH